MKGNSADFALEAGKYDFLPRADGKTGSNFVHFKLESCSHIFGETK